MCKVTVSLRIDDSTKQQIIRIANQLGISQSQAVEMLTIRGFEQKNELKPIQRRRQTSFSISPKVDLILKSHQQYGFETSEPFWLQLINAGLKSLE